MLYFLDANTFIEAKNRYYRFTICPGFWRWISVEVGKSRVFSVRPIYEELTKPNDELADWVKQHNDARLFLPVDDSETKKVFRTEILPRVYDGPYYDYAKDHFLDGADPWLIAKAKSQKGTVVTHEKFEPNAVKKVKIPNICRELNVQYVDTFEVLEKLRICFQYEGS